MSAATSCSVSSQPTSQTKQRRAPTRPPTCGSSQIRSYIRCIARPKLVAEKNVISSPMIPVCARTSSMLTSAVTAASPDPPSPVAEENWSSPTCVSLGKKAAITTSMGISASSPCAAISMQRSMNSIRMKSLTRRPRIGTRSTRSSAWSRRRRYVVVSCSRNAARSTRCSPPVSAAHLPAGWPQRGGTAQTIDHP